MSDADLPLFAGRPVEPPPSAKRAADQCRVTKQREAAREDPTRDYEREWLSFVRLRPAAVDTIVMVARRLAEATTGYIAIAKVWEDARRSVVGGLDQNHRAPAARWLMSNVTDLAGRFRTRNAPGDPTRAR